MLSLPCRRRTHLPLRQKRLEKLCPRPRRGRLAQPTRTSTCSSECPNVAKRPGPRARRRHVPQPALSHGKLRFSFPAFYLGNERKRESCLQQTGSGTHTLLGDEVVAGPVLRSSAPGLGPASVPGLLVSHRPRKFKEQESTGISAAVTAAR